MAILLSMSARMSAKDGGIGHRVVVNICAVSSASIPLKLPAGMLDIARRSKRSESRLLAGVSLSVHSTLSHFSKL